MAYDVLGSGGASGIPGMAGFPGFPGMPDLPGGLPDMSGMMAAMRQMNPETLGSLARQTEGMDIAAMMQNPQIMAMAQNMMGSMTGSDLASMAASLGQSVPDAAALNQLAASLQQPGSTNILRGLGSGGMPPDFARIMSQLSGAASSPAAQHTSTGGAPPSSQAGPTVASTAPAAPAPTQAEMETTYAEQLATMAEMGLDDRVKNCAALRRSGGSVNIAIERIMSGSS